MLHLIINLIHQRIPIRQLLATLLKVRTFRNVLKEHRMDVERVVRTGEGDDALQVAVLTALLDRVVEGYGGLGLPVFDVAFLAP